jgi:tetraprenyl-beta-curcumene synthase
MATAARVGGLALTWTYARAALTYWLSVFPVVRAEARHWRKRAEAIPDPALRGFALQAMRDKRGNVEGSAAFAAFAPAPHRNAVIRAQVAFQTIYDYVDVLAEQPSAQPIRNGWQLHQALTVAMGREPSACDYYAHQLRCDDGGFIDEMVGACRAALGELPRYRSIVAAACRRAEHIARLQSLNLSEHQGGQRALARWAQGRTPGTGELRWWETAAAEGCSLGVFALITAAAQSTLTQDEVLAIERVYWPWAGALHTLLDSVADEAEDAAVGQRSLLDYYSSPEEAAARLRVLTREALARTSVLPNSREHAVVLAGMAGNYLSEPLQSERSRLLADTVVERLGGLARLSVFVFRIRHLADLPARIRLPRQKEGKR